MTQPRQPPWWWQTEVLGRTAIALLALVTVTYLARLLLMWLL
jgi:hypothetical protein